MQIVIDLPDENYQVTLTKIMLACYGCRITELPKGHGDLVDYEELKKNAREYGAYAEATLSHIKPKIIIEADKAERSDKE